MDTSRTLTPKPTRIVRALRLVLHFLWMIAGSACLYPLSNAAGQARLKQKWSKQVLDILAITLDTEPSDAPSGCLIVANHISWLDIFAINAARPSAFIAKAEIRNWPLIGWLAARNDTVFLRRGSHGHARVINTTIDKLLNSGKDVALFPEGTTTDGTRLLGFHAALLQPAIETGRPILPLAISYLDTDGQISLAPSFAGETSLLQCIFAILASPPLTVRLTPLPLIESSGKARRELSLAAHAAIASTLATRPGFHPSSNPPEKSPDLPAG